MRSICRAMLAGLVLPAVVSAQTVETRALTLGMMSTGLRAVAAAYTTETGATVTTSVGQMRNVLEVISTGTPPVDVVFLPVEAIDELERAGGIVAGTRTPMGRVEIGLAVRQGAPHPDISTLPKLIAVLEAAQGVMYADPAGGSASAQIIDSLLKRPEFSRVRRTAGQPGVNALAAGNGDIAVQLKSEIVGRAGVELVGILPPELNAHLDAVGAVSIRSANPEAAKAFLRYVMQPAMVPKWTANGVDRN